MTSVLGTSRTVVTRSSAAEAYVFTSPADCPAVSRAVMRTLVTFLTASNLTFCQTPLVVVNVPLVTTSLVVPSDSVKLSPVAASRSWTMVGVMEMTPSTDCSVFS